MAQNYYLMHHGVKGMKWGVRRTPEQLGHRSPSKKSGSSDSSYSVEKHAEYDSHSFSRVNSEGKAKLDEKLKEHGDAFEDQLARFGSNMCLRMERRGIDYASDAIFKPSDTNRSALRLYDYEMTMNDDKENSYISGSIHVYGTNKVFVAGVEPDYSDEERWYSVEDYKRQYPDLYRKHYEVQHSYSETSDELYHHGIKGMKWGVRRTPAQLGHKPTAGSRIKTKISDPEFQRKAAKAAKIALAVGAMYAGHKVLNNPEAIKAGKNALSAVLGANGAVKVSAIKAITNSSEFKIAKAAGKVGLEGGKKVLKVVSSDNFRKTVAGVGAIATTAGVLRGQIKDLKNKPDGDAFDKAVGYAKKGSAIGESVNTLARGGSSSSNGSSSGNKSIGKEVTDRIGKPSNRGIDKSSQDYQNLFKNRDADTRSTIKSLANAGYDIDQIRKYLEHSAIDGRKVYLGWSFNTMAGCRYIF